MVTVTVSISDKLYDLLREIERETGKGRSEIIREAIIKEYEAITGKPAAATTGVNEKTLSQGEKTKMAIVQKMREMGLYEAAEVPEQLIRNVISQIAGYDERTVTKYFRILYREMLLPANFEPAPKRSRAKTTWGLK